MNTPATQTGGCERQERIRSIKDQLKRRQADNQKLNMVDNTLAFLANRFSANIPTTLLKKRPKQLLQILCIKCRKIVSKTGVICKNEDCHNVLCVECKARGFEQECACA